MSCKRQLENCSSFEERVKKIVLDKYSKFPTKGKPAKNEFTVIAGIVLEGRNSDLHVVSIGTGNKCLPFDKTRKLKGQTLNDSHAEVICKRAFQRFLANQIQLTLNNFPSSDNDNDIRIFVLQSGVISDDNKKLQLKKGIKFHLFVSTTPCGDASIVCERESEYRATGAKRICIDNSLGVLKVPQAQDVECGEMQQVGLMRRKPGKGAATSQMSCSDKLLKWNIMGIQGKLLYPYLTHPIYLSSITIGTQNVTQQQQNNTKLSVQRALFQRAQQDLQQFQQNHCPGEEKNLFNLNKIEIFVVNVDKSELGFEGDKSCPTSLNWSSMNMQLLKQLFNNRNNCSSNLSQKFCSNTDPQNEIGLQQIQDLNNDSQVKKIDESDEQLLKNQIEEKQYSKDKQKFEETQILQLDSQVAKTEQQQFLKIQSENCKQSLETQTIKNLQDKIQNVEHFSEEQNKESVNYFQDCCTSTSLIKQQSSVKIQGNERVQFELHVEVTISGNGYKMGAGKNEQARQSPKNWSRLCRHKLLQELNGIDNNKSDVIEYEQYWNKLKQHSTLFKMWLDQD